MKHAHVICTARMNDQDIPLNLQLIKISAGTKDKSDSEFKHNMFYITYFLICKAWKALDQWNRTLFSHRQITSWSLTQDLQSFVWCSIICLGWFAKWEWIYQQSIHWWQRQLGFYLGVQRQWGMGNRQPVVLAREAESFSNKSFSFERWRRRWEPSAETCLLLDAIEAELHTTSITNCGCFSRHHYKI